MKLLNRLYSWYGKRNVLISLAVIVTLLLLGIFFRFFFAEQTAAPTVEEKLPQVTLGSVSALGSESSFRVTGTVRAVSEARLQTEASGRITSVNVTIGDFVGQGAILASIENSAQRASLLQAEGAYDAAVASAASSESGTDTAENALDAALTSAVNTYKSAFISTDSSVRNTIDDLFTDPAAPIPGFRLDGYGSAPQFNQERIDLEPVLDSWAMDINTVNEGNIESRLIDAQEDVARVAAFAETLASIVARQEARANFTQTEKDALEAEFLVVRSTLNQTAQSLSSARSQIEDAEENLTRAEIAGSGNTVSLSDAQLKSALGSLRAAQASYEKTLVRTPISGVVNALYLKAGEYASPGSPAAVVANNNALEITTALSTEDADMIEIGQAVTIDQEVAGNVTAIAPAIDPISGKKEVKISVSEDTQLTNGSTVAIEFKRATETGDEASQEIIVPLPALKMSASGPTAFTVSPLNVLVAHAVVLGEILGDMVVVEEGLTRDMVIVTDARGLNEGDLVTVTQ